MSITIKNGNLLHATESIIAHQVNGLGLMGAGIAKQIKQLYPTVFNTYQLFVSNHESPEALLGRNLMVVSDGSSIHHYEASSDAKIISNLFGQARVGRSQKQTDEAALRRAFEHLYAFAKLKNLSIAMPYGIGCGLAGGDWSIVSSIIEDVFSDHPVTLYKYNG